MNIPTRKIDDDLMMERYDSSDKAYNRTPKEQAKIDKEKAGFDERTADYHKKNPHADPLRKYRLKSRRSEDAENAGREMGQSFGIDTIEDAENTNPLKSDRVESDLKSKNSITDRIEDAEKVVVHRVKRRK